MKIKLPQLLAIALLVAFLLLVAGGIEFNQYQIQDSPGVHIYEGGDRLEVDLDLPDVLGLLETKEPTE